MEHEGLKDFLRIFNADFPDGVSWDESMETRHLAAIKRGLADCGKKLIDMAENQHRDLSKEENRAWSFIDSELDRIDGVLAPKMDDMLKNQAETIALLRGKKGGTTMVQTTNGPVSRAAQIKGYQEQRDELSEADWLRCLVTRDYAPLATYRAENRTGALMGMGATGGFAIPETTKLAVLDGLLQDQGIFARVGKEFVDGSNQLNVVTYENNDIDDSGLYGFSMPEFISEGGTITPGTPKLNRKTWTLKKLVSETKISIEMNAVGSLGTTLQDALRGVLKYGLEKYIIAGNGVKQPNGLINQPCGLPVSRAGANAIAYADVYNMVSQTRLETPAFIASQTIIPSLAAMVDAGNNAVWMPGISGGVAQPIPTNLMGFPILFNVGLSPALGSKGDLMFCSDLSFYKVVLFKDIYIQTSESAYWSTGELGLRVIVMLDMDALPANRIDVGGKTYGWHTVLAA